jgi:hypothetical protein
MLNAKQEDSLPIHSENVAASLDGSIISESDSKKQSILDFQRRITNLITAVIIILSVAAIALECASVYYKPETVVFVSAILGLILSPTVLLKQWILARMDTLRAAHNRIRMEINRFMEENNELHRNVDLLEEGVTRVHNTQAELERIISGTNQSALKLVETVKTNDRIVKRIQELSKMEFQEELLKTILRSDRDGDMKITDKELRVLLARFRGKKGLRFDEDKLKNSLALNDGSIASVVALMRDSSGIFMD